VRPIEALHAAEEFCEVFFDGVLVPRTHAGGRGQGWSVAMDLLPFERSTALWHRGALLHRRLEQLLEAVEPGALDPAEVARCSSRCSPSGPGPADQQRMAAGSTSDPRRRSTRS